MFYLQNRSPFESFKYFLLMLGLLLFGWAGNFFRMSVIPGVDLVFGSIALLLILYFYGIFWGTCATIIAGIHIIILWQQPYMLAIFAFETLFVGALLRRKTNNLLLLDSFFWILVGIPLGWLIYYYILKLDYSLVMMITLKLTINGIFNALIASLMINFQPLRSVFEEKTNTSLSFYNTIFNMLVAFVLVPSLLLMYIQSRNEFRNVESNIKAIIRYQSSQIASQLISYEQEHRLTIAKLAAFAAKAEMKPSAELQRYTEEIRSLFPDLMRLHIDNANGTSIAFSPKTDENGKSSIGLNFADRDYYKAMKASKQPYLSDVFMGRVGKPMPIVTDGFPVLLQNKFSGYVIANVKLEYIQGLLQKATYGDGITYASLLDRKGTVIASTWNNMNNMQDFKSARAGEKRFVQSDIYQWMPATDKNKPDFTSWQNSFYVTERKLSASLPWTLVLEAPVRPFLDALIETQIEYMSILLGLLLITLSLSAILSRRLTRPLSQLAGLTTNLPDKLYNQQDISWPVSQITEMDSLIINFKGMSNILLHNFSGICSLSMISCKY